MICKYCGRDTVPVQGSCSYCGAKSPPKVSESYETYKKKIRDRVGLERPLTSVMESNSPTWFDKYYGVLLTIGLIVGTAFAGVLLKVFGVF
jgi:ribosomal protein L37E